MTALVKQFIGNNQVDGTKIELLNAQAFNALNASAVQTALFNFSAANNFQFTVQVDMNSLGIINLANPVNPGDAVNYATAQGLIANLSWKTVVVTATTAALVPAYSYSSGVITSTLPGAFPAQDGVTLTTGQRVLIKNETGANQPYNGIYVVTNTGSVSVNFVLTRASDSATAAEIQSSAVCVGTAASTQAGFVYFENAPITTVGTDNIIFDQINAGMSYVGGNGITITGNSIAVNPASGGAITSASGGISVNTDGSTIGITGNNIYVLNAGITQTQIASSSFSASGAITGGSGTSIAVAVDGSTVEIVSNQLHGLSTKIDTLTLNSTDITNQYKDVTYPIAVALSTWMSVIGGPVQQVGQDFSVSATGGVAGVGRITFLNGLASGGAQALISGNVLVIGYNHF